jgi:hypothetical protein
LIDSQACLQNCDNIKEIKETCMIEITSAIEMATHSNCKTWQMGSSRAGLI